MKAIIYAGIGLFSVASAYGVADYYSTQKKGELYKLYAEEKVSPPAPVVDEKKVEVIPVKHAEITPAETKAVTKAKPRKKIKKVKKTIRLENFSRGRIEERVVPEGKIAEKKN